MLDTSKNIVGARSIIKVLGYQYRWLATSYDLEIGILEVSCMVVTLWLVAFSSSDGSMIKVPK